jgi:hypothetical protein
VSKRTISRVVDTLIMASIAAIIGGFIGIILIGNAIPAIPAAIITGLSVFKE